MTTRGWQLEEALALLRLLAPKIGPAYHLALAGSVLLKGYSNNDLDVIVYPASSERQDKDFVVGVLRDAGLKRLYERDIVTKKWRKMGSDDAKHVEVWEYGVKKVDLFFLS